MGRQELEQRFKNLKTLTKLMMGFPLVSLIIVALGTVGVMGLRQLKEPLRVVYEDSTVVLADIGNLVSNLGLYHDAMVAAGRVTRRSDFEDCIRPLPELRAKVLETVKAYASRPMRVTKT